MALLLSRQTELPLGLTPSPTPVPAARPAADLVAELSRFDAFGTRSQCGVTVSKAFDGREVKVPTLTNEFWTARQRQANRLHEVSYRACFKPQLPRFFIKRLTDPGDRIYDPFMGRGTTLLESALLRRVPVGNDINPLSTVLVRPRLRPVEPTTVADRLAAVAWNDTEDGPEDLLVFYHPNTLRQIIALQRHLQRRTASGELDAVDEWIRMVALNRLTGHSTGFFSVYTLPPNQATSIKAQRRINERRDQVPTERDVAKIILKKSRQLLGDCGAAEREALASVADQAMLLSCPADATPAIASDSIRLVVTSPPFLNIVQYATDNWLRCWFLGIDAAKVPISTPSNLKRWQEIMTAVFVELHRVLQPGGRVAFEVGEVRGGDTKLEEAVLPCGLAAQLEPELIVINAQEFTKTANCWGVDNNSKGTNSNRIVLFHKPG